MLSIATHLLPNLVKPEALAGGTVVVFDILRATSTITYALAHGAARVIPCGEIDEAQRLAERIAAASGGERPLLGGERHGLPIDGFDGGNSPCEYPPERVAGRTLVFTTTNGTRAMLHARQAARVVLGSFVSLSAVVESLRGAERVHLLCAGTEGEITREDVLGAGSVATALAGGGSSIELNDEARLACDAWRAALSTATAGANDAPPAWLVAALGASRGGRNVQRIGLARDLPDCAALDRFHVVPELDTSAWEIRLR